MAHPGARRGARRCGGGGHRGRRGDGQQASFRLSRRFRRAIGAEHEFGAGLAAERDRPRLVRDHGSRQVIRQEQLDVAAEQRHLSRPELLSVQLGDRDVRVNVHVAEAQALVTEAQAVVAEAEAIVVVAEAQALVFVSVPDSDGHVPQPNGDPLAKAPAAASAR